jgi:hypothetical protein
MKWSEELIARAMARQVFERKHLVLVPRCNWTGNECDLLVVTPDLRVIDVEVKISRADLKADAKKDKWFHSWDFRIDGPWVPRDTRTPRPRQWPRKVWKHYFALPAELWDAALFDALPSPASGVILLNEYDDGVIGTKVVRRATPCRDAERISAGDAVDIARLASLRMWDAFDTLNARARKAAPEMAG